MFSSRPLRYSCLRIPWTEKPGRLQSIGSQSKTRSKRSQRDGHDWSDLEHTLESIPLQWGERKSLDMEGEVDLWNNSNHDLGWPLGSLETERPFWTVMRLVYRQLSIYKFPIGQPLDVYHSRKLDLTETSWGISEENWKLKVVSRQHSQQLSS